MTALTASGAATHPDRETAQWATQQVVTANEQLIHRRLVQATRPRPTIEAHWNTTAVTANWTR
ncbi:hypothetical protein [Streptomyces sp. LN704]|uniref:hypothetical protein n=1 Tax=unclassified Streptomyces TaxID=2593676 RepID=UPI003718E1FA